MKNILIGAVVVAVLVLICMSFKDNKITPAVWAKSWLKDMNDSTWWHVENLGSRGYPWSPAGLQFMDVNQSWKLPPAKLYTKQ